MELHLGFGDLNDDDFIAAFESCILSPSDFHHADHVRIAWLYVRRFGPISAETRMLSGIRALASHAGAPQKFLHTTTVAWVKLIAAAHANSSSHDNFAAWIVHYPALLDRALLDRYYSRDRLAGPAAREGWLDPDLAPLALPMAFDSPQT